MNFPLAVFGAVVLALLTAILFKLWRLMKNPLPLEMQLKLEEKEQAKLKALQQQFSTAIADEVRKVWSQMQEQVRTTDHSVSGKLAEANKTLADLSQKIGQLEQATKQVEAVGRDVSSLQDLLRAPKMRGGFGEFFLADLLKQIMPADFYVLQFEFSDGCKVDAAVRLNGKLVPVDSKFPLEQFQKMSKAATDEERLRCRKELARDVKKHIDAIHTKYIRPAEGTFDFALMYIPAENVYYETAIKDEALGDEQGIFQHAISKRVIPVSPNSFYAYLQVILMGLRGMQVEQQAKEILGTLMKLQKEFSAVREDFDRAGNHLRNATKSFESSEKRLGKFEEKLESIEGSTYGTALPAPPDMKAVEGELR